MEIHQTNFEILESVKGDAEKNEEQKYNQPDNDAEILWRKKSLLETAVGTQVLPLAGISRGGVPERLIPDLNRS
jgi:hypothetical protein